MTDGNPSDEYRTKMSIGHIMSNTDQHLIALGVGPETDMVKDYFPISRPNIRANQLTEVLGDLLEDVINNPEKYKISK